LVRILGDGEIVECTVIAEESAAEAPDTCGIAFIIVLTSDGWYLTIQLEVNGTGEFEIDVLKRIASLYSVR
jgi:hypothetical protein